ncbi:CaiB/BaiF CoA transferase family protein [Pacificimonas flava]|uniref:L-carnitine dehydratase/bile acid-inducible protein F n=1 Tax=Pacificimonas flava TaxID=1234595 RepID=M2TRK5_9SPHN|nr:CaiB/BaiF CoA-transferase family protein [Pacificimonas flava]EMD84406.1 L-carnitine dehydratase/bile acid-inducible protein F [Pacificimonas flava]MBB5279722.1 crotonobetainyl-CoA:carnitine CoA-transferase CaiB-like acyl-CoA transferase [Pacificimonas flava]
MTTATPDAPLAGLLVIDMAQFLSGPSAALRLADMGARVIKVERPGSGDICRSLYLSDTEIAGDSTLFHAINRNKESLAADLKDPQDLARVKRLIGHADIVIQNFRPGVAPRLGLGPQALCDLYPELIVGTISGYGEDGPWADLPGQDLLAQALSGVMWLNGDAADGPVPVGLSIADMLAGHILVEGLLAALVRRGRTARGGHVETSLLEAITDFQFEVLTTHLNDGGRPPQRAAKRNAHAYLSAPYGVYRTANGWLALAMTPLPRLGPLLDLPLADEAGDSHGFRRRDRLKRMIGDRLAEETTEHWLEQLRAEDVWCAPVLDWPALLQNEAFRRLAMLQRVEGGAEGLTTTRAPWRLDGERAASSRGAPQIGEHTDIIRAEFSL